MVKPVAFADQLLTLFVSAVIICVLTG